MTDQHVQALHPVGHPARADAGDLVDVADVVNSAVAHGRSSFPARPIEVELAPELPPVRGDAIMLEQVIFNLLDNADKYVAPGLPTVVSARAAGPGLTISVSDKGPGIPAAELDRVFDKFHRVAQGDGRPAGTGLGLSMSHDIIVKQHGGKIDVETTPGAFTEFIITLPRTAAQSQAGGTN